MNRNISLLLTASAMLVIIGAGCSLASRTTTVDTDNEEKAPLTAETTTKPADIQTFKDVTRGISFSLPKDWTTGTDENGNLYTYKQSPYSTVAFDIFTNKAEWDDLQKKFNANTRPNMGSDVFVKEETLTVGGFPTIMRLYERGVGEKTLFQYGKYFVDGGTRWYLIETSDPSEDIDGILKSVTFIK